MDEVRLDLEPEVAPDRARGRLQRVGGADYLPGGGHGLVALDHHRHERPASDELDQVPEEGLLAVLGVVPLGHVAVHGHVLHGNDRQTLALEARDHLAREPAGERVWLDQDQRAIHSGNLDG